MERPGELQNPEGEPTLSLCMIVKDEEDFLDRCLKSVMGVADEMIIVDTGSTDRTVEIAESYGAEVHHHPWNGSFSEARNYGLQFASCDWIFQIDADEELEKADIPILQKAIRSQGFDAIFVALLNEGYDGWSKHYFQRLFRRGRAHYCGIVHNQLICEGRQLQTEIRLYHYGYNLSEEQMQAKFKRTETLLLKQLANDATDPFAYQNYIRVIRASKKFKKAVEEGEKALQLCGPRMNVINRQML